MDKITLDEKYILEYIKDMISSFKIGETIVSDSKYHHNSNYEDAANILKYGILSIYELNRLGIKKYSEENLTKMNDTESHVNGNDKISLSIVGLTDLSPKEYVYNPYYEGLVDFLISSDITARRNCKHYGNEYLADYKISNDKIKSVDIRLLKLIEQIEKNKDIKDIEKVINKYNYLKDIALSIKENNLYVPLREMTSGENIELDIDKIKDTPKILIK